MREELKDAQGGQLAAVVLCAGEGRRMQSHTPKILHTVCGKPMGFWVVEAVAALGIKKIIVVLGHNAQHIQAHFMQHFGEGIVYATQQKPLGTGDALKAALPFLKGFEGTALILCGDVPLLTPSTLEALVARCQSPLLGVMASARMGNPTGYGRVVRDQRNHILQIVEEGEASGEQKAILEVNAGLYAFDVDFLHQALPEINNQNTKGEFYLTDLIQMASKTFDACVGSISIEPEEMQGINNRLELAQAESTMRQRIVEKWMKQGVTCIDPARTYIDAQVILEEDVVLHPGVMLLGNSHVAQRAQIGVGTILTDTQIGQGAQILPYCVGEKSIIEAYAIVGPFAHLRAGTHLEEKVKIGNFVELKNTRLKRGAKANHLAYLGDTIVGEGANIGAGAISCNYDGFKKSTTLIGNGAFIGSNTTLVAPVEIGDGAYVAAGSTITQDVPGDSLAFGRAGQVNKEGYLRRPKMETEK